MLSAPAWIVVITVLVLTTFAMVAVIAMLVTHLRELATTVASIRDDLRPRLEALQEQTAVTQAELERVREASDELADQRDARRTPARGHTRAQG